ncbi:FMN-binding protein [Peptoniphilus sp. AGMB00490]|uniref:FMN-binding protein n=1 Tax=Peptoniphilus faecalis TaxID=2731255 RepID=A0A848R695_9FIRM|nr:S-layer homology domain-containing protein [Peptoniphilus faecalis]NMW84787.1 FMN-binding protein [Peptoniphilus faecalis]
MKRKLIALMMAMLMMIGTVSFEVFAKEELTNKQKVDKLVSAKIVEGDERGNLNLGNPIKRSEITKILIYSLGYKDEAAKLQSEKSKYSDVNSNHWAKGVIQAASKIKMPNGQYLIAGYPDGTFKPEKNITEAELIKLMVVATKKDLTSEEMAKAKWPNTYIDWAKELKIIGKGTGIETIDPNKEASRELSFVALFNATENNETKKTEENKKAVSSLKTNTVKKSSSRTSNRFITSSGSASTSSTTQAPNANENSSSTQAPNANENSGSTQAPKTKKPLDGEWYAASFEGLESDKYGPSIVKVKLTDEKIDSVEAIADGGFKEEYLNIAKHILPKMKGLKLNDLDKVLSQINNKKGEYYDSVTNATITAKDYVKATKKAIQRSIDANDNKNIQDITYIKLRLAPGETRTQYMLKTDLKAGEKADFNFLKFDIAYANGRVESGADFTELKYNNIDANYTQNQKLEKPGSITLHIKDKTGYLEEKVTLHVSDQEDPTKIKVETKQMKMVKANGEEQDTGIVVKNKGKDTTITANNKEDKQVPVRIDESGKVFVTPNADVGTIITIRITDKDLPRGFASINVSVDTTSTDIKKISVDKDNIKTVNATNEEQDTGILVKNSGKETTITAINLDGDDVVDIRIDDSGKVLVTPGTKAKDSIHIEIFDDNLPDGSVEIEVPVDNNSIDSSKISVDKDNVKTVNATNEEQDTGIVVKNKGEETTITATNNDYKEIPVSIDESGRVFVTPGTDVGDIIYIEIADSDLPYGFVNIDVPVQANSGETSPAEKTWFGTSDVNVGFNPKGAGPNILEVKIDEGLVKDIKVIKNGGLEEGYIRIAQRILLKLIDKDKNAILKIEAEIDKKLDNKNYTGEYVDVVSSATKTAKGYIRAVANAIDRSEKYSGDKNIQDIAYIKLSGNNEFSPEKYRNAIADKVKLVRGESADFDSIKFDIAYGNGLIRPNVKFSDLKKYGIETNYEQGQILNPEGNQITIKAKDKSGYAEDWLTLFVAESLKHEVTPTHFILTMPNGSEDKFNIQKGSGVNLGGKTVNVKPTKAELFYNDKKIADGQWLDKPFEYWKFENFDTSVLKEGEKFETSFYRFNTWVDDKSELKSIKLNLKKNKYFEGETLSKGDFTITTTTINGTVKEIGWDEASQLGININPNIDYEFTKEDTSTHEKEITISYKEISDKAKVQVLEADSETPTKVEVKLGEELVYTQNITKEEWNNADKKLKIIGKEISDKFKGKQKDFNVILYNESNKVIRTSNEYKYNFNYANIGEYKYVVLGHWVFKADPKVPTKVEVKLGEELVYTQDITKEEWNNANKKLKIIGKEISDKFKGKQKDFKVIVYNGNNEIIPTEYRYDSGLNISTIQENEYIMLGQWVFK